MLLKYTRLTGKPRNFCREKHSVPSFFLHSFGLPEERNCLFVSTGRGRCCVGLRAVFGGGMGAFGGGSGRHFLVKERIDCLAWPVLVRKTAS